MKFLVIGLGSMGKRRIRNLKYLGYTDIAGVDIDSGRRSEAEKEYSVIIYDDFEKAVEGYRPDAIIISTPPDKHTIFSRRAAELGIDFFVEASVIDDGLEEVAQIAEKNGVLAAPSCTMRFKQSVRTIKKLVGNERIGKVLAYTYHMGQYLPDWHPWEDYRNFYGSKKGIGASREMVCFEGQWLRWIFGKVQNLCCMSGNISDLEIDVEDHFALLVKHDRGIVGNVLIDILSRTPYRQLKIIGSDGNIEWDFDKSTVRIYDAKKGEWEQIVENEKVEQEGYWAKDDMYIDEMDHFIKSVKKDSEYSYPLSEDIETIKILDRAVESSKNKKNVEVD